MAGSPSPKPSNVSSRSPLCLLAGLTPRMCRPPVSSSQAVLRCRRQFICLRETLAPLSLGPVPPLPEGLRPSTSVRPRANATPTRTPLRAGAAPSLQPEAVHEEPGRARRLELGAPISTGVSSSGSAESQQSAFSAPVSSGAGLLQDVDGLDPELTDPSLLRRPSWPRPRHFAS